MRRRHQVAVTSKPWLARAQRLPRHTSGHSAAQRAARQGSPLCNGNGRGRRQGQGAGAGAGACTCEVIGGCLAVSSQGLLLSNRCSSAAQQCVRVYDLVFKYGGGTLHLEQPSRAAAQCVSHRCLRLDSAATIALGAANTRAGAVCAMLPQGMVTSMPHSQCGDRRHGERAAAHKSAPRAARLVRRGRPRRRRQVDNKHATITAQQSPPRRAPRRPSVRAASLSPCSLRPPAPAARLPSPSGSYRCSAWARVVCGGTCEGRASIVLLHAALDHW